MKVFTDGSSSGNGKKNCLSGCGVYFPETGMRMSMNSDTASKLCGLELKNHSNNVGELLAILVALISIEDKTEQVVIYSDSMYCINSLTVWYKSWKKNNWNTSGGTPVKNREIIEKILEEKEKFNFVFFRHVKAHTKEPLIETPQWEEWNGNNIADKLATDSLFSY